MRLFRIWNLKFVICLEFRIWDFFVMMGERHYA